MMIRNCLATRIRGRWYSGLSALAVLVLASLAPGAGSHSASLASLAREYRESPTPARRAGVAGWAAAHPDDGALAQLALGVVSYEQQDYPGAIAALERARPKLPQIADYSAYYLAAARVESNDLASVASDLVPAHSYEPVSPLLGKSWLLEARALKDSRPAEAVRLLREHYSELPQPDADLALADCYQAAGELAHAADFYQRVYFQYVSGDAALRSAAALAALKDTLGRAYPAPLPQQILRRADRLLETRAYAAAQAEYQGMLDQSIGLERDQARVRMGAADYLGSNAAAAYTYLDNLALAESEADAERLYYIGECARRLNKDDRMLAAVRQLGEKYPHSLWRLKVLISAANRFLLVNRPDDFLPLYKTAYRDFPADPAAGLCHWKVAFQAYLRASADAGDLLREHLRDYPAHPTAAAALYFLARLAEQQGDLPTAHACYARLAEGYRNYYYGILARQRLARTGVANAVAAATPGFLAALPLPEARPVPADPTPATTVRIERARLLRAAGLNDLAEAELRFGARTDGQPALLAMEIASTADAPHQGLRAMKMLNPDYLALPPDGAPRKFWELLFPLPYRGALFAESRARALDPYVVAGIIRQESEFDPEAVSSAKAYGLTQVRPGTGRLLARKAGIRQFSTPLLFQPAANLKLGTTELREMLDQNGGNLEQALAAYNAGPNRVAEWITWNHYREPAEFVETIPFTETRDYVQAVLRNAEIYRRLDQH